MSRKDATPGSKYMSQRVIGEDIREVLETIGTEFAWLGLRKANRSIKCYCTENPDVSQGNCSQCLGTGFGFTDRLISGYFWMATQGKAFMTEAGRIATQTRNLILQYDYPLVKFDQVLLLDVDPDTGEPTQPFKIMRRFLIQDAIAMRDGDGRLQFWKCEAEERSFSDDQGGEPGTDYHHISNR